MIIEADLGEMKKPFVYQEAEFTDDLSTRDRLETDSHAVRASYNLATTNLKRTVCFVISSVKLCVSDTPDRLNSIKVNKYNPGRSFIKECENIYRLYSMEKYKIFSWYRLKPVHMQAQNEPVHVLFKMRW